MQNNITKLFILVVLVTPTFGNAQQMKDSIINDNSFVIKDNQQDSYQGVSRNGKPYDGYFKKGDRDFFIVDYYEKGNPVYQYSVDLLKKIEQEDAMLDLKSTYKGGKIVDGPEYTMYKHGFITKNLKNGVLESFIQDIFAIHYYNRITFKKENDTILISNLKEKDYTIKLFLQNNAWVNQLVNKKQILLQQKEVDYNATVFPPNSEVSFYKKDGIKRGMAFKYTQSNPGVFSDADVNKNILDKLEMPKEKDIIIAFENIFNSLIDSEGFSKETTLKERPLFMGYLNTNATGKIKEGIRYIENKESTVYRIYENEKIIKEEKTTIEDFQQILNNYFTKKNSQN